MNDTVAKMTAAFSAFLLAASLIILYVTSNPGVAGTEVRAEFDDVYPLLPGMHVRVDGAVAGSVGEIEVADDGKVLVDMTLNAGTDPPRADATAAIRQQDITGDSYVSLEPGDAAEPLGDTIIPTAKTLVAPRFDDLLDSFSEPVRQGLRLVLIELGKGLEGRGADLNGAILQLRPGLAAANEALAEVRSQNAVLRDLIVDTENVTGQTAAHTKELASLVDSLSATLQTTARHGPALDAALAKLPSSSAQAERTLTKLGDLAVASKPLAQSFADAAPELVTTLERFGPFLGDVEGTMEAAGPTLTLFQELLDASLPTLREAPSRVLTAPLDIAAGAGAVLDALIGERDLQKALFSADGYGEGEKAADDVGLGAVGVERGGLSGYEGQDPDRRFLRAETVLSCESLGLKIAPGCLDAFLARTSPQQGGGGGSGDGNDVASGGGEGDASPAPAQPPAAGVPENDLLPGDLPGGLDDALEDALDQVGGALGSNGIGGIGGLGGIGGQPGAAPNQPLDLEAVQNLLDYLTR